MRFTTLGNRLALAAAIMGAIAPGFGCRRSTYIDQTKPVPHETTRMVDADEQVKRASTFDEANLSLPLPKMTDPRTTSNPEAQEIWNMTLEEAIKIGLDNSEVVRVIALGAQGIPIGGFEPTPLNTGAGGALGTGTLTTVYDPAIQETGIAQALSVFDASLSATIFWNRNVAPFNNAITAGTFIAGAKNPVVFTQESSSTALTLQKRTATGATLSIVHNITYNYSNSPSNVFPSAYTTNLQMQVTQPLLGSAPNAFNANPNPVGLEANRAPIVVQRLQADVSVWRFKSEVMAMVRSIEQQYWAVSQAQVQYWASETAVDLGEQTLKKEEARYLVGTGALPNLAEAAETLERFRLDYVDKTANLITVERQLRNILGLPPTDNRRIVPVTAPTEARLEPNWQASLAQMVTFQPDIVQNQLLTRVAELQLLVARNQLLPVLNFNALYQLNGLGHHLDQAESVMTGRTVEVINPLLQLQQRNAGLNPSPSRLNDFNTYQVGLTFQMPLGYRGPLANNRNAQYTLLRQRAFLQQVVHQTTHSLARFFLEVDSNYKLFKTAGRLKEAARQRLDAQAAFYENGTITIDRYLDAVNRWATAVAQEADFRTRYNTSIVALEEAKGTLLAYDNIAMAEGPWPAKAYRQARDQQEAHGQSIFGGKPGPYQPNPISSPPQLDPVNPMAPPDIKDEGRPGLPAPAGPFGRPPTPSAPTTPAGNLGSFSRRSPATNDPNAVPVSATTGGSPESNPPLPGNPPKDDLPALPGN